MACARIDEASAAAPSEWSRRFSQLATTNIVRICDDTVNNEYRRRQRARGARRRPQARSVSDEASGCGGEASPDILSSPVITASVLGIIGVGLVVSIGFVHGIGWA